MQNITFILLRVTATMTTTYGFIIIIIIFFSQIINKWLVVLKIIHFSEIKIYKLISGSHLV